MVKVKTNDMVKYRKEYYSQKQYCEDCQKLVGKHYFKKHCDSDRHKRKCGQFRIHDSSKEEEKIVNEIKEQSSATELQEIRKDLLKILLLIMKADVTLA